ncbi:MAG: ATP-grasp domain-containing protein [Desulfocapsaceae bacterium]
MSPKCAFLTLEDRADFCIYDHLLFEPLEKLGWSVEEVPWNHPNIDWERFDAVVIRSTWDYQNAPGEFLSTLAEIESVTSLYNPVDICRWNLNKRYLLDLQTKGVQIVPTHWLKRLKQRSIESIFQNSTAERLVAKPLVGANADDTFVLESKDSASWNEAICAFSDREAMVQPFIDSIEVEGEYSLFYFGGHYSHAIVKRPADGDFRVQEEHGGIIRPVNPAEDLVHSGNQAIEAIEKTLLYARVDLVRLKSGQPALIEMELIEPSLYFEQDPKSAEMFAAQFERMTGS